MDGGRKSVQQEIEWRDRGLCKFRGLLRHDGPIGVKVPAEGDQVIPNQLINDTDAIVPAQFWGS
jgi:hypothetical protein